MGGEGVGILPDEMGEGGLPWQDKMLRVQKARTVRVKYQKGEGLEVIPWNARVDGATSTGLEITFVDGEGNVYPAQFLSGGDPARLVPSMDGKTPSDEGEYIIPNPDFEGEPKLVKTSNVGVFISEALNAGYPIPLMKAAGNNLAKVFTDTLGFVVAHAVKPVQELEKGQRPKTIPIFQRIEELPGEGKGKKAGAKVEEPDEEAIDEALTKMVKLAKAMLKEEDEVKRADFVQQLQSEFEDDEQLALMSKLAFEKGFKKALGKKGLELDGETIKKEED